LVGHLGFGSGAIVVLATDFGGKGRGAFDETHRIRRHGTVVIGSDRRKRFTARRQLGNSKTNVIRKRLPPAKLLGMVIETTRNVKPDPAWFASWCHEAYDPSSDQFGLLRCPIEIVQSRSGLSNCRHRLGLLQGSHSFRW